MKKKPSEAVMNKHLYILNALIENLREGGTILNTGEELFVREAVMGMFEEGYNEGYLYGTKVRLKRAEKLDTTVKRLKKVKKEKGAKEYGLE